MTRFEIDDAYGSRFEVHTVGDHIHQELWVPAESLTDFNAHNVAAFNAKGPNLLCPYIIKKGVDYAEFIETRGEL